jgi:NAD(P)-dependent dehydrogenase (short-subunit alcohol dehydrogenase family)
MLSAVSNQRRSPPSQNSVSKETSLNIPTSVPLSSASPICIVEVQAWREPGGFGGPGSNARANRRLFTVVLPSAFIPRGADNLDDRPRSPLDHLLGDFGRFPQKRVIRHVDAAMLTHFLTATAAGRIMSRQRSGVVLTLTATPGGIGYPMVGGFGPACCAIEAFSRNLAAELGPHGVRVVNIRSAGSPDSQPFREAAAQGGEEVKEFFARLKNDTMLKEMPLMKDIANAAVFLASDLAGKITGVTLDVTAGTTGALNYKMPTIAFVER